MFKVQNHPNLNVKKYCLKHFLIAEINNLYILENFIYNGLLNLLNQG